jgi:hypothetical protein
MQQFALRKSADFTAWINECEIIDGLEEQYIHIANGAIVEQPLCNGAGR